MDGGFRPERKRSIGSVITPVPHEKLVETNKSAEEIIGHWIQVTTVASGSPSERAGLCVGDQILGIDGEFNDFPSLIRRIQKMEGHTVKLQVRRHGESKDLRLTPTWSEKAQCWIVGFNGLELLTARYGDYEATHIRILQPFVFEFSNGNVVPGYIDSWYASEDSPIFEIKKFVIGVPGKDGMSEFDLLERFNRTGTRVICNPDMDSEGRHYRRQNVVEIKSVRTPDVVHILTHELRHAEQALDERFTVLKLFYTSPSQFVGEDRENLFNRTVENTNDLVYIEKILEFAFPGSNFQVLMQPVWKLWEDFETEARKKRPDQKTLDSLTKQIMSLPILGQATIRDIRALPTVLIERDAEYGSLKAIRTIRKETGIDFGQPYPFLGFRLTEEQVAEVKQTLNPLFSDMTAETLNNADVINSIHLYMSQLGLSRTCLREMRKAAFSSQETSSEDLSHRKAS